MRGDRPKGRSLKLALQAFTPHARGSTSELFISFLLGNVYPACAGIDRLLLTYTRSFLRLPRMRGDRPSRLRIFYDPKTFTPHARGSTLGRTGIRRSPFVYPACAGIDPDSQLRFAGFSRLPRMRGDRPFTPVSSVGNTQFTPHARGSTPARSRFL